MLKRIKQKFNEHSNSIRLQKAPVSKMGIEHLGKSPRIRRTIAKNLEKPFGGKDVFKELSKYSSEISNLENLALKNSKLKPFKRQSKLRKVLTAKEKYGELSTLILKFDNEKSIVQHKAKKDPSLPPKTFMLNILKSKIKTKIKELEMAIGEAKK